MDANQAGAVVVPNTGVEPQSAFPKIIIIAPFPEQFCLDEIEIDI
jgi:hypothetical protein